MSSEHLETEHEREAYKRGVDAAVATASWVLDGNNSREHYERLLEMMDDGDPALHDWLPRAPNLSGEFADDPTPRSLALEILGDLARDATLGQVDAISAAFEQGVADTFERTCEAHVRQALA